MRYFCAFAKVILEQITPYKIRFLTKVQRKRMTGSFSYTGNYSALPRLEKMRTWRRINNKLISVTRAMGNS